MGDYFQALVFRVPSETTPASVAESVLEHLVREGIVSALSSDCALGDKSHSYAPGESYESAISEETSSFLDLVTNGLEITTGRTVEMDPQGASTALCEKCEARFEPTVDFFEAVSDWYDGNDEAGVECPKCKNKARITDWHIKPAWGLGNLVLKFWNWPPLRGDFIAEIASIAGYPATLVRGRL